MGHVGERRWIVPWPIGYVVADYDAPSVLCVVSPYALPKRNNDNTNTTTSRGCRNKTDVVLRLVDDPAGAASERLRISKVVF